MSSTFFTGNTGVGTGAHLDFRVSILLLTGKYEDPSGYTSYLTHDGKAFDFKLLVGSSLGVEFILFTAIFALIKVLITALLGTN